MHLFKVITKTLALCLVAIFGAALYAQNFTVAVTGPDPDKGSSELREQILTIKNKCEEMITSDEWFSLFSRDRETLTSVMAEHKFQEDKLTSNQKRDLEQLGVDYLFRFNVRELNRGFAINYQLLDIKSGQVMGSKSGNVPAPIPEAAAELTEKLMKDLLKDAKARMANNTMVRKNEPHPFLKGFESEIKMIIEDVVSIRRWNQIKDDSDLEVDFSGISITSNFDDSHPIYKVKGRIKFILTDSSRNSVNTSFSIPEFTQTGKGSVQNRIEREVKQNSTQIVSDLLKRLN